MNFTGTATDPDNNLPLTYLWEFGAGSGVNDSLDEDPGTTTFNIPGTYTVSFTVTDALGLSDPSPGTRTVSVQAANQAPNGVIDTPACGRSDRRGRRGKLHGYGYRLRQ